MYLLSIPLPATLTRQNTWNQVTQQEIVISIYGIQLFILTERVYPRKSLNNLKFFDAHETHSTRRQRTQLEGRCSLTEVEHNRTALTDD